MLFCTILAIFFALFGAIEGKKCCNSQCTQVISQARSFREYQPTDSDGLVLERDAKIWIFMKEMGLDEDGDEMWYGESKGKKGYFPKQLVGEYMVLCRDLVEISFEETYDRVEENREIEEKDEVENSESFEGTDEIKAEALEPEENRDSEAEKTNSNTPSSDIPDMVNEWRKQNGDSFNIPPQENIAEFHAPDTEAMQALKREMDRDFLSRLLEGEGVETVGELEGDRLDELMRDSETARILISAFQEEEVENIPPELQEKFLQNGKKVDQENPRETSHLYEDSAKKPEVEQSLETEDREISQPKVDETNLHPGEAINLDLRQSRDEEPQEENVEDGNPDPQTNQELDEQELPQGENSDEVNSDISKSSGDLDEERLPQDDSRVREEDSTPTDVEDNQEGENLDVPVSDEDIPEQDTDQGVKEENTDQGVKEENTDQGVKEENTDFTENNGDVEEEILPQGEESDDRNLDTSKADDDNVDIQKVEEEISHEGDQISNNPPSEDTEPVPDQEVPSDPSVPSTPLNLPHPLSQFLHQQIQSHGIAALLFYVLTPVVIAYLYLSRNVTRNRVDRHKKESAKHVKVLEQKVVVLQKEKKVLETKIAESNENAVSRDELLTLRQELDTARNEVEGNRGYISQLEADHALRGEELQTSQSCVNEKSSQVERMQTLNSSAQEEILALNGKMDTVKNQVTQVETEKLALQVRIDTNIDSYSELKERLDGVEESRDQVERDKTKLQEELKEKQVLITANTEQIHTLHGEIGVLSKSLLKLQPGNKSSQTDTHAIFETLTNTAKALSELDEARSVKERLELENSHLTTDNTTFKARCEDLDDNLSCCKSNNILLKKQLGDSETKLQVLNEYFNTKESELHRQLNEVKNSQMLLEGKDQRTHEEIGAVRTERETLKLEISGLKQQHGEREKSLLEQISSLEKRAQENIYNSRRNEQDIRWRDREITELKRKLAEASLPSSQSEPYLSPRSTSPSSQISSNSDTEAGARGDKTRESPSMNKFTSVPTNRMEPVPTTAKQPLPPNAYPQAFPHHSFYPPPYPGMMPGFRPPQLLPPGMGPAVFNSPSAPVKRVKSLNMRNPAPDDNMALRPIHAPENATAQIENMAPKSHYAPEGFSQPVENMAPKSQYAPEGSAQLFENMAPKSHYAPEGFSQPVENMAPRPALYAASPPTLIDAPNEYSLQPGAFDSPQESGAQQYTGSLLDSQNNTPTQKDTSTFLIDV